jgi:hypothetical protein
LKKEVLNITRRLKSVTDKNQIRETLSNKILNLKKSKKKYKRAIFQLKHVVQELNLEIHSKQTNISALTTEIKGIKSSSEQLHYNNQIEYEKCLYETREKYDEELLFYKAKVSKLESEASKQTSEILFKKELAEKKVVSLVKKIDVERKEKSIVEKKLKLIHQSFEEQTRKTQEALRSVCCVDELPPS